jgi:hypothetical protein
MHRLAPVAILMVAVSAFAAGGEPEIAVALSRGAEGRQQVRCGFWIGATPRQVWEVLTDYEGLPRFAPSLTRSKVLRGTPLTVEQQATVRVLLFSRRVRLLLEVTEVPFRRLGFVDRARQGARTYVTYELEAVPSFQAPRAMARSVMRELAVEFVGAVRDEIRRRERPTQR